MDDVDSSAFVNGKVLEYDSTLKKWKGGTGGGGGSPGPAGPPGSGSGSTVDTDTWTASQGTAQVIQTYGVGDYHCTEYTIHVTYGSKIQVQKLLVMDNGSTVYHNQYAVMYSNEKLLDFSAAINGSNIEIKATPETGINGSSITCRAIRQVI